MDAEEAVSHSALGRLVFPQEGWHRGQRRLGRSGRAVGSGAWELPGGGAYSEPEPLLAPSFSTACPGTGPCGWEQLWPRGETPDGSIAAHFVLCVVDSAGEVACSPLAHVCVMRRHWARALFSVLGATTDQHRLGLVHRRASLLEAGRPCKRC